MAVWHGSHLGEAIKGRRYNVAESGLITIQSQNGPIVHMPVLKVAAFKIQKELSELFLDDIGT